MFGFLRERYLVLRAALLRPWPKRVFAILFFLWGIVEIYDLVSAQFLPRQIGEEVPIMIEVLSAAAEWLSRNLSSYDWLLISLATVLIFTLEFAVRQNRKFSSLEAIRAMGTAGISAIPYQEWKNRAEIDLDTAAAIWAGTRDPDDVTRHLRFRELKQGVRNGLLKPHKMPNGGVSRRTTVKPEALESFFRSVSPGLLNIVLAESIQTLRTKNDVKKMKKLHSGCNLSNMPIGVYGFICASKLPSPNSRPDIVGVGEYRIEPPKRPISRTRQVSGQCEVHKTNSGILYVVGCISKEQFTGFMTVGQEQDKEFMLLFEEYDEFTYSAAIPYRNIESFSHRLLDDGSSLFDVRLRDGKE